MKTTIITIIVCLIFLYFALCPNVEYIEKNYDITLSTTTKSEAHSVGSIQGNGNAKPLESISPSNTMDSNDNTIKGSGLSDTGLIPKEVNPADYSIVVFVVSTDKDGSGNAMNTTAIVCYTRSIGNGRYVWRGMNSGWAGFEYLHYTIEAKGTKNGLTSVSIVEYMLGEKTDHPVYIKDIMGL